MGSADQRVVVGPAHFKDEVGVRLGGRTNGSANWDFLPTFCELVGIPAPAATDGISMAPTLLKKGTQPQHDHLYWKFHEQDKKQAVLKGPWKAVLLNVARIPRGPIELYNLDADARETRDVSAQHPETAAGLTKLMNSSRTEDPN